MRASLLLLLTFGLLPLRLSAQTVPTPDQLRQWLDASHRRSYLITDGATPFHIVLTYEGYPEGKPTEKATIDEIWKDPFSWKRTITSETTLTEVHNDTQAWATGTIKGLTEFGLVDKAVFSTFAPSVMTTHRLTFEPEHGGIKHLDCIGTEPELPGVAADVKLAETTYCLDIGNHLLRFLDLPGEASIQFNDISPFADKFIARTIEVFVHSQLAGRIHIEKLEPVTDFTALDAPVPAGVKPFKSWRQDNVPAGFMRGQLLSASVAHSDVYLYARQDGTVVVQAQIDTTGTVTSVKLLKATNSIVANRAMAGIKTWHYRVSYQGDKLVPITLNINLTLPQS